ncbi:MAG: glycosyltransferase [Thermodesulfobacteria bacterium]|nr:glycosyltransferase [Thermodesulfobacteriota bacterium]
MTLTLNTTNTNYLYIGYKEKGIPEAAWLNPKLYEADILNPIKGIPYNSNQFSLIFIEGFLEKLSSSEAAIFLRECRRCLKPGGILKIYHAKSGDITSNNVAVNYNQISDIAKLAGLLPAGNKGKYSHENDVSVPESLLNQGNSLAFYKKQINTRETDPLVSIIIPSFKLTYFQEALDSALNQRYENIEIIVADDSPNGIFQDYLKEYHPGHQKIKYHWNRKTIGGRNNYIQSLKLASGEFIKFLNDDDILHPDCIRNMLNAFYWDNEITLVTSHRQCIDEQGQDLPDIEATQRIVDTDSIIKGPTLAHYILHTTINYIGEPTTAMFRKADVMDIEPDFLSFAHYEAFGLGDVALWLNLLSRGDGVYLTKTLSFFRLHEGQRQHKESVRKRASNSWIALRINGAKYGLYHPNKDLPLVCKGILERNWHYHYPKRNAGNKMNALSRPVAKKQEISRGKYMEWTLKRQFNLSLWEKESSFWKRWPSIKIFLHQPDHDMMALADTIDSLLQQPYPNWHFTVIAQSESPDPLFDTNEQLSWIKTEQDFFTQVNQFIDGNDEDWLIFLRAGDLFKSHCLTSLVATINKNDQALIVYSDHDFVFNKIGERPQFKPDFNLDMLRSSEYIHRSFFIKRELFKKLNGFSEKLKFAEHYDLLLRAAELVSEKQIIHLSDVILSIKEETLADEEKALKNTATKLALQLHLKNTEKAALAVDGHLESTFRCIFDIIETPLISIVVTNEVNHEATISCIDNILEKTTYKNFEIIVTTNKDRLEPLSNQFDHIRNLHNRIKILQYDTKENYSHAYNTGVSKSKGEYLLFLSSSIEIIQKNWLDILLSLCQRQGVGAVGPRIIFPDGHLEHAGMVIGFGGIAGCPYIGCDSFFQGYMNRLHIDQNYSAISGLCLMVKRQVFEEVEGFDKNSFQTQYWDVDFCLRLKSLGYINVWTPHVTVMHHPNVHKEKNISAPRITQKLKTQIQEDKSAFEKRWFHFIKNDPAYNYNLSLEKRYFDIDIDENPGWPPAIHNLPRIWAYPRAKDGAGEYRIRRPLGTLEKYGHALTHCAEKMPPPGLLLRHMPSAIVFQTPTASEAIAYLKQIRNHHNGLLIYEIDDLLHHVPFKNPAFNNLKGTNLKKRIREATAHCDRMIVSTEPLADAYSGFCKDIRVVPNYISMEIWGNLMPKPGHSRKPRVGWAGGAFHYGDLMVVKDVIRDLADEVDWVFMGMCPDEIRPYVAEYHEGVDIDAYPAKLATLELDLAIAPLEINAFNKAKSNLRILEYGILGWPVVVTDIYPYQGAPVTLVKNRYKAWINAIRDKISDRQALIHEGQRLRSWVIENWILEDHLDEILDAYTN